MMKLSKTWDGQPTALLSSCSPCCFDHSLCPTHLHVCQCSAETSKGRTTALMVFTLDVEGHNQVLDNPVQFSSPCGVEDTGPQHKMVIYLLSRELLGVEPFWRGVGWSLQAQHIQNPTQHCLNSLTYALTTFRRLCTGIV